MGKVGAEEQASERAKTAAIANVSTQNDLIAIVDASMLDGNYGYGLGFEFERELPAFDFR